MIQGVGGTFALLIAVWTLWDVTTDWAVIGYGVRSERETARVEKLLAMALAKTFGALACGVLAGALLWSAISQGGA